MVMYLSSGTALDDEYDELLVSLKQEVIPLRIVLAGQTERHQSPRGPQNRVGPTLQHCQPQHRQRHDVPGRIHQPHCRKVTRARSNNNQTFL